MPSIPDHKPRQPEPVSGWWRRQPPMIPPSSGPTTSINPATCMHPKLFGTGSSTSRSIAEWRGLEAAHPDDRCLDRGLKPLGSNLDLNPVRFQRLASPSRGVQVVILKTAKARLVSVVARRREHDDAQNKPKLRAELFPQSLQQLSFSWIMHTIAAKLTQQSYEAITPGGTHVSPIRPWR
ncbi:hypothetical protein NM208_g13812 [Fusarium decemcellulare]|uniref:Uncharacterized protein n=1 Tax=Fusarium decemcellulare TaxID=57161 RepID=A0ACC1RID5_9HYPO|nr:hypothetical protein NM208_g13812 [Fusarium decemcellulare]